MRFVFHSLAFLALACLAVTPGVARADTHLTFCYDPYPPYTLGEQGPATKGLKVDLLQAVVARIDGVTAEVVLLPWKRCQESARDGQVDGILPLFRNAERAAYLDFTDGTFVQTSVFWYRKASFPEGLTWSRAYDDIAALQLGMLTGAHIDTKMQEAFEAVRPITRTAEMASLFLMLGHGRVDLVALDLQVGRHFMALNDWSDTFAAVDPPISSQISYFGLSRASGAARYLPQFNAALAEMRAAGEIEAIYAALPE
ncbi:MAG: transporter substrate-binding domain-containing protein [Pseudomonadota bacterium]